MKLYTSCHSVTPSCYSWSAKSSASGPRRYITVCVYGHIPVYKKNNLLAATWFTILDDAEYGWYEQKLFLLSAVCISHYQPVSWPFFIICILWGNMSWASKQARHIIVLYCAVEENMANPAAAAASLCVSEGFGGSSSQHPTFITSVSSSGTVRLYPHRPAAAELCRNTHRSILCATTTHYNVITVFNMWSLHQYLIINITAGVLTACMGPAGNW